MDYMGLCTDLQIKIYHKFQRLLNFKPIICILKKKKIKNATIGHRGFLSLWENNDNFGMLLCYSYSWDIRLGYKIQEQ